MIWEAFFVYFCLFTWWYLPMAICHGHPIPYLVLVIAPYTYYSLYSRAERNGSREWNWLRSLLFWRKLRRYFPLEITIQQRDMVNNTMKRNTNVFVSHPHGVFNWSVVFTFMLHGGIELLKSGEAEGRTYIAVHHHLFYVPILRDLLLWMGCIDERYAFDVLETRSRCNARQLDFHDHLVISPGRDQERLECDCSSIHHTYVQNENTDQIRKALELGYYVVPVFCKGENLLYMNVSSYRRFGLLSFFQWTTRMCGRPVPNLAFGVFFSPFPLRHRLNVCIGLPLILESEIHPAAPQREEKRQQRSLQAKELANEFYIRFSELYSVYCTMSILRYSQKKV